MIVEKIGRYSWVASITVSNPDAISRAKLVVEKQPMQ